MSLTKGQWNQAVHFVGGNFSTISRHLIENGYEDLTLEHTDALLANAAANELLSRKDKKLIRLLEKHRKRLLRRKAREDRKRKRSNRKLKKRLESSGLVSTNNESDGETLSSGSSSDDSDDSDDRDYNPTSKRPRLEEPSGGSSSSRAVENDRDRIAQENIAQLQDRIRQQDEQIEQLKELGAGLKPKRKEGSNSAKNKAKGKKPVVDPSMSVDPTKDIDPPDAGSSSVAA